MLLSHALTGSDYHFQPESDCCEYQSDVALKLKYELPKIKVDKIENKEFQRFFRIPFFLGILSRTRVRLECGSNVGNKIFNILYIRMHSHPLYSNDFMKLQ